MFNYDLSAAVTLAVGLLGALQWYLSWRAGARQRDSDLTRWGGEVIDVMAELETACYPIVKEAAFDRTEIERLSYRASALVDKGRLFFPNVENGSRSKDGDGTRVKLLDEVLRACYVARHLAHNGTVNNRLLREQVWEMRDRFIRLLQKEMSASLRPVDKQASGQSVALDPTSWSKPKRKLKLPGDETVP